MPIKIKQIKSGIVPPNQILLSDGNGNIIFDDKSSLSYTLQDITVNGNNTTEQIIISNDTQSSSIGTGALIVSGGTSISGNTYLGDIARYSDNFSGLYDNRSLVDKEYIDNSISNSGFLKLDQTNSQDVINGAPQFDGLKFNLSGTTNTERGRLEWNQFYETLEFGVTGDTIIQIGQELVVKVKNSTNFDMFNGQLVYPIGAEDGLPIIQLAEASISPEQLGILTEDILSGQTGFVTIFGVVNYLDTSSFTAGDKLYLGIIPGEFTDEQPGSPYYNVPLGVVLVQDSVNGTIIFDKKPSYNLEDLANVRRDGTTTEGAFPVWGGNYFNFETNINDYLKIDDFTGSTTLQDVTERGSTTDIESTFSSGLITNRIKPEMDDVSAVEFTKSDNTSIISIDTISGFTGFQITEPQFLIHAFGTDTNNDNPLGIQRNGINIDGVTAADKDIIWLEDGDPKWIAETYRNELSKFWYLYNVESENEIFAASEGGRTAINPHTNLVNRHSIFLGQGLNDLDVSGIYDKNYTTLFLIEIDSTGSTDTFRWSVSYGTVEDFGDWEEELVDITGDDQELESGVSLKFDNITGHSLGDTWVFVGFSQLPLGTFEVLPHEIDEVLISDNIQDSTIIYKDITGNANTTEQQTDFEILNSGNTDGALYIGTNTQLNGVVLNIIEGGEDITLITEYWNGDSWIDISVGNPNYIDETNNLSQRGVINWGISSMVGWVKSYMDDLNDSDEYNKYWIRLRSVSIPTKIPRLISIARGGKWRIGVYSSPFDYKPSFFVDTLGRTNIGGGNITGTNVLQINTESDVKTEVGIRNSLVEIDSNDPEVVDLKIKLSSDDDLEGGLTIVKTRGTLSEAENVQFDDMIGHVDFRAQINDGGGSLGSLSLQYKGDGTTKYGDLIFKTATNDDPTEKVRITNDGNTGFGLSNPSALIHITSGDTSIAPLKFTSGVLLTTPESGAIEFLDDNYYGTNTSNVRKTFAFLESPTFTGSPELPIGTTLDGDNLNGYILQQGGDDNPNLTKQTDFEAFTGSTVPWEKVDKTGSDLVDLETRNAEDINLDTPSWDSTNLDDISTKLSRYVEDTQGSGRLSPDNVLFGELTNTLSVSGGTGYINYPGFHKYIIWDSIQFDTSTGYTEGTYWVYVDTNGDVLISDSDPGSIFVIRLGVFYLGDFIGVIQQCGCVIENSTSRLIEYVLRQGIFIYDGGGDVTISETNTLKFFSSQFKAQNGMIDIQLSELSSDDAASFNVLNYHNSADFGWLLNYNYNVVSGVTPTDRWNDITQNSNVELTGFTSTFTQGSNTVTVDGDVTPFDLEDTYIYLEDDGQSFMTPVSGVTWDGVETTITLERSYLGSGGQGVLVADYTLPRLSGNTFVKHLIVRGTNDIMYLVLSQTFYLSEEDAFNAPLPEIPELLNPIAIKMAFIVHESYETDLTGKIFDIRPLPYTFREGGQAGGGTTTTNHGSLSGLDNDDHLQYLRTDGSRSATGILSYSSSPTFTSNNHIVNKLYVDDGLSLKTDVSTFDTFTGTTLPNNYYNKTEVDNIENGLQSDIDDRLLITDFNSYSATTESQIDQVVGKNPLYAFAKTQSNGTIDSSVGISVTRVSTGTYDYVFNLPLSDFNYGVFAQPFGTTTDTNSQISNVTINGFRVEFGQGDNGGTPDVLVDTDHAVSVYGVPVSGDTSIPVVSADTFNTYSGNTQNTLDSKAPINSPDLTGTPTAPTATVNTSSTQIATTEFVVEQASETNPLMNGTVAIGTSLRYSREDHIHPSDTSRLSTAGGTITGSLEINTDLTVDGTSNLTTVEIDTGLAKYNADYSTSYDNRTLVDKEYVDTLPLTTYNTTSVGTTTTTTTTYILQTGMQITNVPAGTYLVGYGTSLTHNIQERDIFTSIYIGGVAVTNSEMNWRRGNKPLRATHNYANFPITLNTTSTVEIRWRTTSGTATSTNRYLTLLKVSSIV